MDVTIGQANRAAIASLLLLAVLSSSSFEATADPITRIENGVAYIEVATGTDIQPAFDHLSAYLPTDPNVDSGVVDLASSATFGDTIVARDDVTLNIRGAVTLTLDAPDVLLYGVDLSNTLNSGVTGGGTLDVDENAVFGIYGTAVRSPLVGNPTGPSTEPLRVVGWRQGVAMYSTRTVAAGDVRVINLELREPATSNVRLPLVISSRPSVNGLWVNGATVRDVTVNGADANGNGGQFSESNRYTADQITLQGVHDATLDNVTSLYGGENGFAIAIGSRNVTVTNSTASFADGHGFNIGSGTYAIDVADSGGFTQDLLVRGETSGAIGRVWRVFPGRLWIQDAEAAQFLVGEVVSPLSGDPLPATTITAQYRTTDVALVDVTGEGNGLDVSVSIDPEGNVLSFADFYLQQADSVSLSGVATSFGRLDTGAPFFGVFATASTYTLGDLTYEDYGINQIPVGSFGGSVALGEQTGDSIINVIASGGAVVGTGSGDLFNASENDDDLRGLGGNDDIDGRGGNDTLDGGAGDDRLVGGEGDDLLSGGEGDDELIGGNGADLVIGGSGNDLMSGEGGGDTLLGNAGADRIDGGNGPDVISGGAGNDTLTGGDDADTVDGNDDDDTLDGGPGDDALSGGGGDDVVTGGEGDDELFGNDGEDVIDAGGGSDFVSAGEGDDTVFGGDGLNEIYGNSGADRLVGGDMAEILSGDDGNDTIFGNGGADTASGGQGNDTIRGGDGGDTLSGADGADTLIGNSGNDALSGGSGNDRLFGNDGDDELNGQGGNDFILAGAGADVLSGGDGADQINGSGGMDLVDGNDGDDVVLGGADDDELRGSEGNDSLFGQSGNDDVTGSFGDDFLNGGGGDDFLYGNDGADRLFGSSGADSLFGGADDDFLNGGPDDDTLNGNTGDDFLSGFTGNDVLFGNAGNDALRGGRGDDTVSGSTGTDRFIFERDWGNDTITDFADGQDRLDMRNVPGVTAFSDLIITEGPGGSGVLIRFGDDSVLLLNRRVNQIESSDFLI